MEETPAVTRERVRKALWRDVLPAVYGPTAPLAVSAHHVGGEPISAAAAMAASYEPFEVGGEWGAAWDTTWFRLHGRIPDDWRGAEVVVRVGLGYQGMVGFGAEAIVWEDGVPAQGLSPKHSTYRITEKAAGGDVVDVLLEAAANPVADLDARPAPSLRPDYGGAPRFRLDRAELAVCNRDVEGLALDMDVLLDLYDHLPHDEPRASRILRCLVRALNVLDFDNVVDTSAAARDVLVEAMSVRAPSSAHRLAAVGNAHIDTAWLWPFRETVRKCARTFSTALRLMDEYPDYRFACSQPQQLAWMKEQYPKLFERIKERVREGRFELVGAMWVEADCNVPSGESLVRQIVHGCRFLEDEFGITPGEVWLPDVFGYAASLPQIMRRAGITRFLTQKLSWSTVNRVPHHTFWWEGIDGSRVLTHFPPADTYNGDFSMDQLEHNVRSFKDHDVSARSLYLFGYGDGGGGPTRELLEKAARYRDIEGAPRVEMSSVEEFWEAAQAELLAAGDRAGVWVGELYLEFHRGTYTTSAMSKRENRSLELLLREAELWSAVRPDGMSHYPSAELDKAWKDVLLLQFHDVLPGTSIAWVYDDSRSMYASARAAADSAISAAVPALLDGVDTSGMESPVAILNSSPARRREVVSVFGEPHLVDVPALGYVVIDGAHAGGADGVVVGDRTLENEHLRVTLADDGTLSSVWDKDAGREVLAAASHAADGARGNLLQLHEDRPPNWDAWDIDASYMDKADDLDTVESITVVEGGGLVGSLRVARVFGRSRLAQDVVLRAGSRRIDFVTEVDWQERHKLLKACFPVDVHARRATYEIQYGHVERPTHRNTSWDWARFEVCAQKWADLSEPGYGVALLNDGKYGHDVFGNVMRLSLLRASSSPAPDIDRGVHRFTYALFPHVGDLREAGVIEEAYALNLPLRVVPLTGHGGSAGPASSRSWAPFAVSVPGVFVEVVKRAERTDAVVVRLYEAWGRRTRATLSTVLPFASAAVTDLLERSRTPLPLVDGALSLDLHPFEITTLVFELTSA
jgi:alpha-mannosidase